jgi:hypothetical protein
MATRTDKNTVKPSNSSNQDNKGQPAAEPTVQPDALPSTSPDAPPTQQDALQAALKAVEAREAELDKDADPKGTRVKLCHPDYTADSGRAPFWVRAWAHLAFKPGWRLEGKWVVGQPSEGYPHTADGRPFVQVSPRYQTRAQAEQVAMMKVELASLTPAQRAERKAAEIAKIKSQKAAAVLEEMKAMIANGMPHDEAMAQAIKQIMG